MNLRTVVAIDGAGREQWRWEPTTARSLRGPAIIRPDGLVLAALDNGDILAVRQETGLQWRWSPSGTVIGVFDGPPLFGGRDAVYLADTDSIHAVNLPAGAQ
jgi:hypothetical protein